MKYVPVLRYRQEERRAIMRTNFSNKLMPLIELIKEKPHSQMKGDFRTIHQSELSKIQVPFMVDFPMNISIGRNTQKEVVKFLRPIQTNQIKRVQQYTLLKGIPNLIPVVSYDPRITLTKGYISAEAQALRSIFPRLAFRIFLKNYDIALNDLNSELIENDIVILDLGESPHNNPGLTTLYAKIVNIGKKNNCETVLIRSAIPDNLTNLELTDDQVVAEADNSLLVSYKTYGFTAFGDYAGVKKDSITNGGSISPGFIFYSWHDNCYIGYKGRVRDLSEFEKHIVPTVMNSIYWKNYLPDHHKKCGGCQLITKIAKGIEKGNSQPKWKGISIMHYLYTMEEFL